MRTATDQHPSLLRRRARRRRGAVPGGAAPSGRWDTWLTVAQVVGPTSLLTALGLYFGYVTLLAEFGYFGVSIDTLDLSTRAIVLRSVGVLYAPMLLALVCALVALAAHIAIRGRVHAAASERARRGVALAMWLIGGALVVRGMVGIVVPEIAVNEIVAATPVSLGAGVVLSGYGFHLWTRVSPSGLDAHRTVVSGPGLVLMGGVLVLCTFWAANSFAAAYGRGQAINIANDLEDRPEVILDVREELRLGTVETTPDRDPLVTVRSLCAGTCGPDDESRKFKYRYRGLRLLAQSDDRMLLVPRRWFEGAMVLVVDLDRSVRVQFVN